MEYRVRSFQLLLLLCHAHFTAGWSQYSNSLEELQVQTNQDIQRRPVSGVLGGTVQSGRSQATGNTRLPEWKVRLQQLLGGKLPDPAERAVQNEIKKGNKKGLQYIPVAVQFIQQDRRGRWKNLPQGLAELSNPQVKFANNKKRNKKRNGKKQQNKLSNNSLKKQKRKRAKNKKNKKKKNGRAAKPKPSNDQTQLPGAPVENAESPPIQPYIPDPTAAESAGNTNALKAKNKKGTLSRKEKRLAKQLARKAKKEKKLSKKRAKRAIRIKRMSAVTSQFDMSTPFDLYSILKQDEVVQKDVPLQGLDPTAATSDSQSETPTYSQRHTTTHGYTTAAPEVTADPGQLSIPTRTCECQACGEVHYFTFDGQVIHFVGACSYTLSKTRLDNSPCSYNVEITNEASNIPGNVSSSRTVTVQAHGVTVSILPGKKILVRGHHICTPLLTAGGRLQVTLVGTMVQVALLDCGVKVSFDGEHLVRVSIPWAVGETVHGICGDCNGVMDDFRLKGGVDVSDSPVKFTQIANSYLTDTHASSTCTCSEPSYTCSDEDSAREKCSVITNSTGVFGVCNQEALLDVQRFFDSCVMDYCKHEGNSTQCDTVFCDSLKSFAMVCRDWGHVIDWRTQQQCPMLCGLHSHYSVSMSSCQATCATTPDTCDEPDTEGCECDDGYIQSATTCVNGSECGCFKNDVYYMLGQKYTTSTCSCTFTCELVGAHADWIRRELPACATGAECRLFEGTYQCACREGYIGDGSSFCAQTTENEEATAMLKALKEHKLLESKVCLVSGDSHYKTFDGQMILFAGACKYTLVKSVTSDLDPCAFNVEVKNEHRDGRLDVSFTSYVEVSIFGLVIRLEQELGLLVNGVRQYPPVTLPDGRLSVQCSGYMQVLTSCGLEVMFDGNNHIAVRIPPQYKNNVTGLCGNSNDNKADDFLLRNGSDVRSSAVRNSLVGESFTVSDDSITQAQIESGKTTERCLVMERHPTCSETGNIMLADEDHCSFITKQDGPFSSCMQVMGVVDIHDFVEACVYDLCAYEGNLLMINELLCDNLAVFAYECNKKGVTVVWRTTSFCPAFCPVNSHYNPNMTGCQASCTNQSTPVVCMVESREGCECDPGYVLSSTSCVDRELCGCRKTDGTYIPIGESFLSDDCTSNITCQHEASGSFLRTTPSLRHCDVNAECVFQNGDRKCQCLPGFSGDGTTCHKISDPPSGNVDDCLCMLVGHRFYNTFDGDVLDFHGNCEYLLTHYIDDTGDCNFTVTTRNINTGMINAFRRFVHVDVFYTKITLGPARTVLIDGVTQYPPVLVSGGRGIITVSGRMVTFLAQCGLTVSFDGEDLVYLSVAGTFREKLNGLCGNCDGVRNELIFPSNSGDMSDLLLANTFSLTGTGCEATAPQECSNTSVLSAVTGPELCDVLTDRIGCFAPCLATLAGTVDWIARSCVKSHCTSYGNECDFLEALSFVCLQRDFVTVWRTESLCPPSCGMNQQYSASMSGCRATCSTSIPSTCPLPRSEGCQCSPGYVLSGTGCVTQAMCGCVDTSGRYYPVGTEFLTGDCKHAVQCKSSVLGSFLQLVSVAPCVEHAVCTVTAGNRGCVCQEPFTGSGTVECTAGPCTCLAQGDPHYTTYDNAHLNIYTPCKYLMSASSVPGSSCSFRIEGKHELRRSGTKAFIASVDVMIGTTVATLDRGRAAWVNGVKVVPPVTTSVGNLTMIHGYLLFTSTCGLTVASDGYQKVSITAPGRYRGNMTGLCGNCNNIEDDDTVVTEDYATLKERDAIIAANNLVMDETIIHTHGWGGYSAPAFVRILAVHPEDRSWGSGHFTQRTVRGDLGTSPRGPFVEIWAVHPEDFQRVESNSLGSFDLILYFSRVGSGEY